MPTNRKIFICFTVITFVCLVTSLRQINIKNMKFYDTKSRQIYLHGINVVVKVPPYMPSTGPYDPVWSFNTEDYKILHDNGFNAVRLGVMWAGVEPKKDWYNQTYLSQMLKIVNEAGQNGIYTLIQFHQDILSQKFCGDGVPSWLMDELHSYKSFPYPTGKHIKLNASGLPDWSDCDVGNWAKYYFSYDVGQGFNDLYNPRHKLNKKFNDYWQKVAQTFKGNPYVIAYELINQPWIGNIWRNPSLILPSQAQRAKLQQFYDKLSQTIRAVDSQTPLCFEPLNFDNFVPAGFSHGPGGKKYNNLSILCYHYYAPPALNLSALDSYVKDGKRLGIPSMLSQSSGGPSIDRAQYWNQAWMYWIYKSFGKNWGSHIPKNKTSQQTQLSKILKLQEKGQIIGQVVRTYLQRVAGTLQLSKFNATTGYYQGSYFATPGGQTTMFLSKNKVYKNGYQLNVYPQQQTQITSTEGNNWITIKYNGQQRDKKILVTVTRL